MIFVKKVQNLQNLHILLFKKLLLVGTFAANSIFHEIRTNLFSVMEQTLPLSGLMQTLPIDAHSIELLEAMSIYQQTKEVYEATNVALGRGFEFSIFNSSSNLIKIEANECHSTTTFQV